MRGAVGQLGRLHDVDQVRAGGPVDPGEVEVRGADDRLLLRRVGDLDEDVRHGVVGHGLARGRDGREGGLVACQEVPRGVRGRRVVAARAHEGDLVARLDPLRPGAAVAHVAVRDDVDVPAGVGHRADRVGAQHRAALGLGGLRHDQLHVAVGERRGVGAGQCLTADRHPDHVRRELPDRGHGRRGADALAGPCGGCGGVLRHGEASLTSQTLARGCGVRHWANRGCSDLGPMSGSPPRAYHGRVVQVFLSGASS